MERTDSEEVSTPAAWQPGEDVIVAVPHSMDEVNERLEGTEDGIYCLDWFMCLKRENEKGKRK